MSAESINLPDAELSMGREIMAHERRARLIWLAKLGVVWAVLLAAAFTLLIAMRFDLAYVFNNFNVVINGLMATILISFASVALASILALLGALGRLSTNPLANGISGLYVSLVRGTPLLVQLYIVYLGLPRIGVSLREMGFVTIGNLFILDAIPSGIMALGVNYGAYMTEIFRAGLQSISHGQWEAAQSLGMTRWQTLRRIILPQAIRVIIPDIGNQFIAMQKDSALVSAFGVWEMTYLARELGKRESKYLEMFLVAALAYWALTIVSSYFQQRLERRMAHAYER